MRRCTIGNLWSRYLQARASLEGEERGGTERLAAEREARGLRDRLVVNYSPLVKYVAAGISSRMTGHLDQEDVVSWGLFGLLDAVETYDPGRRTKFESYAISKIRWSILDELRKIDPLPRRARLRMRETERARNELAQRLGRAPTEPEVARRLGVEVEKHRALLDRFARAQVGSLEARLEGERGPGREIHDLVADRSATDPASAAEAAEVRARLVRAIGDLSEQERVVTTFYYYEGLTLREIGGALNLTEGRISQILRRALLRLRRALAEDPCLSERA
ncbi:MAG: FliA/WhiG family RNA polymerase sigma factor [Actinomycetota bacterium]|nr:FliA/WhiG family RNA polymerase sigma factor [Actinomycetota bacterium]